MKLKDYLKDNILLTDGAFGTYYAQKYGHDSICERANIDFPQRVRSIHKDYIEAGAKLIRTNTFAANKYNLNMDEEKRTEIIKKGYEIAVSYANDKDIIVAADIGPVGSITDKAIEIPIEDKLNEYKAIIDIFVECGAEVFLFETMPSVELLDESVDYIRKRVEDAFIIVQFAVLPDAHTSTGISAVELIDGTINMDVDVVGFNCGSGPSHMLRHIKRIKKITNKPISALPNASFPSRVGNRTFYVDNEKYFADIANDILSEGVKIIGGCCGTTPGHIRRISDAITNGIVAKAKKPRKKHKLSRIVKAPNIDLLVEISPPLKSSTKGMLNRINTLKDMGVRNVTLPDSPLGRSRMNPVIISSHIRQQCLVDTIAHLCCRDRNITALRSDVLAAWAMGLRKILCITGDPVAAGNRDDIKSVFNLTSTRLIKMISHMNRELFSSSPIEIYGAIDFSVPNFNAVIKRTDRKIKAGANVLLSQPIYSDYAINNIKVLKEQLDIKVYAGIMPPVSYRNAKFLNNEVPGIRLPDEFIEALEKADEDTEQQVGVRYAVDIAKHALEYADGIYLMLPFGRVSVAADFFEYFGK